METLDHVDTSGLDSSDGAYRRGLYRISPRAPYYPKGRVFAPLPLHPPLTIARPTPKPDPAGFVYKAKHALRSNYFISPPHLTASPPRIRISCSTTMVSFLIPRSQTLEIADCPKRLAMVCFLCCPLLEGKILRILVVPQRKRCSEDQLSPNLIQVS
jgi:hypothetical protein